MPRKPKPPPTANMVIEGLSDGREVRPLTYVDDFDGRVKPVVQDMQPVRRLKTGWELEALAKSKARKLSQVQEQQVKALTKVLTDMIDPPKREPFKRRI